MKLHLTTVAWVASLSAFENARATTDDFPDGVVRMVSYIGLESMAGSHVATRRR